MGKSASASMAESERRLHSRDKPLSVNRPLTPSLSLSEGERVLEGRVRGFMVPMHAKNQRGLPMNLRVGRAVPSPPRHGAVRTPHPTIFGGSSFPCAPKIGGAHAARVQRSAARRPQGCGFAGAEIVRLPASGGDVRLRGVPPRRTRQRRVLPKQIHFRGFRAPFLAETSRRVTRITSTI